MNTNSNRDDELDILNQLLDKCTVQIFHSNGDVYVKPHGNPLESVRAYRDKKTKGMVIKIFSAFQNL